MQRPWNALTLGMVGGAVLCAGIGIRWSVELARVLSDPLTTTWLSALLGAVIGGAISYVIARQASRETLDRDISARLESEHSSSLRAIVTAMQVTNRLYTLNQELERAVLAATGRDPWLFLLASSGPGSVAPSFLAGDFIPFIKGGHSDVIHRATLTSERLASSEAAQQVYSTKRQEFQQFAAPYTTTDATGLSSTVFTGANMKIAEIKARELSRLFADMLKYSREYLEDAKKLCTDMNSSHQAYFGKKAGFRLEMDEQEPPNS